MPVDLADGHGNGAVSVFGSAVTADALPSDARAAELVSFHLADFVAGRCDHLSVLVKPDGTGSVVLKTLDGEIFRGGLSDVDVARLRELLAVPGLLERRRETGGANGSVSLDGCGWSLAVAGAGGDRVLSAPGACPEVLLEMLAVVEAGSGVPVASRLEGVSRGAAKGVRGVA